MSLLFGGISYRTHALAGMTKLDEITTGDETALEYSYSYGRFLAACSAALWTIVVLVRSSM